MSIRSEVLSQFKEVAKQQSRRLAPLVDDLPLLESGLDSLGIDPLSASEDALFPVTLGDFVKFYENAAM